MALLDRYLLPLCELTVSIAAPALLTLKALQLTSYQDIATGNPQSAHVSYTILRFWVSYWLLTALALIARVNSHLRCLVAVLYCARSELSMHQLVSLYEQTFLPLLSSILYRVSGIHFPEAELDNLLTQQIERLCLGLEVEMPTRTSKLSFWSSRSRKVSNLLTPTSSNNTTITYPESPLESMVPLEISRIRSPRKQEEEKRSRRRSQSLQLGSLVTKKSSKQNLRTSSWNIPQIVSIDSEILPPLTDIPSQHSSSNSGNSSRVSSGDLVFEDPPDRRSFKESIKGMFA